ncbi:MAG: hypothetical protein Kow0068_19540 [Marinilabiliales bacterium]
MKILFYISILCLVINISFAQETIVKADSLIKQLNESNVDSEKLNLLFLLSKYYSETVPEKAKDYCLQGLAIANRQKDSLLIATFNNILGKIYIYTGDYDNALVYQLKSLEYAEKNNDKDLLISNYLNLGIIHRYLEQYDKSLEYFNSSLKLSNELKKDNLSAIVQTNIAIIYHIQKKYTEAIKIYENVADIYRQLNDSLRLASTLGNIGILYKNIEDYNKALEYFEQCLDIFNKTGNQRGVTNSLNNLAGLYLYQKKYEKVIKFSNKSLELAKWLNLKTIIRDNYLQLAEAHFNLNQPVKAYTYLKQYIIYKDSVLNDEVTKQINELQTKYETEKKEKELIAQQLINKQQEAENKRQWLIIYFIGGGFIIILILSILLFKQSRERKKANVLLSAQNEEINQQKEEILAQRDEIEKQRNILEEQKNEITDSIRYAKRIQNALLPPENYLIENLPEHFILFLPRDIVSGDFYWAMRKDNLLYFTAADCTGHGVPGAFMSILGMTLLKEIITNYNINDASEVLALLRDNLINALHQMAFDRDSYLETDVKDGLDIAFCILDINTLSLKYAGAYSPLVYVSDNKLYEVKADRMPIGIIHGAEKQFTNHTIQLKKGDMVYLFSDGFADQFGGDGHKKFKSKRFKKELLHISGMKTEEQKKYLIKIFNEWKQNLNQLDDILVMGLRI